VKKRLPLELIRFVRIVDETEHEIATNGHLNERYKRTGRYGITRWVTEEGVMELQISSELYC